MAQDVNFVVLNGRLTRDVELKQANSGTAIGNMSIAVNDRVKRGNEYQDEVSFFDVTMFGKTAENAHKYISKGRMVTVAGKLQQQRWETDGGKRSKVVVIAQSIQFLDKPEGAQVVQAPPAAGPEAFDDDIPF